MALATIQISGKGGGAAMPPPMGSLKPDTALGRCADETLLTICRKNITTNPFGKGVGFRLVAAEDQSIQAGFGDDGHFLLSARGVYNMDPLFIFIQPAQCLSHVTKAENLTHILRHRPRFAVKGINLLMPIR